MNDDEGGFLLDTHAIIWFAQGDLHADVVKSLNASAVRDRLFVSPISAWEIGLLASPSTNPARRLNFSPDPETWFRRLLSGDWIKLAPLAPTIAIKASFLPEGLHKDPADRLLVTTAREMDLTLVTRDRHILTYSRAGHVRTLRC